MTLQRRSALQWQLAAGVASIERHKQKPWWSSPCLYDFVLSFLRLEKILSENTVGEIRFVSSSPKTPKVQYNVL